MRSRNNDNETRDHDATTVVASTVHPTFRTAEALYPVDFSPRLIALHQRLQRRGQEPLFPASWQLDFLNLPSLLFMHTLSDPSYAPIRSLTPATSKARSSSEFRGKLAMERLLRLGKDVREAESKHNCSNSSGSTGKVRTAKAVEVRIVEGIKRYIFWTAQDAMVTKESLAPFITISTLGRRRKTMSDQEAFDTLTHKTTMKMRKVAKSLRDAASKTERASRTLWRTSLDYETKMAQHERALSTTIYGFAIYGSRMAIVGLNVRLEDYPIRTLLALDFGSSEGGHGDAREDLWSVLAIMLAICAAREERLDTAGATHLAMDDALLGDRFSCMKMDTAVDDEDL